MWVDLLFENYLIMLPSTTSLKQSSVKKSVFETHSHTTLQNCVRERVSRGHLQKGKIPDLSQADTSHYQVHKIQPITKHHVLLLGFAITTHKPTENCQCHARTNHTSARVSNDTSTLTRVNNDINSLACVSDDTGSLARVSNDIGGPIRL